MRTVICFLTAMLFVGVLDSCKQGCKDKHAINYNSQAANEDGSCLYCDSSHTTDGGTMFAVDPGVAPAPYTNQNVLLFVASEKEFSTNGNGCKSLGLVTGQQCNVSLKLINLTNRNVNVNFNLFFEQNGFTLWQFNNQFGQIAIGPNDTINFGTVDTACSNFTTGFFDLNFNAQYF